MKKIIVTLFLFSLLKLVNAQSRFEVLLVSLEDSIDISDDFLIKEIHIKRKFLKKNLKRLTIEAIDSARLYNGNCLQIIYHDKRKALTIVDKEFPDYLRAKIYNVSEAEQKAIRKIINTNQLKRDSLLINRPTTKDFEIVLGMQYSDFNLKTNAGFSTEQRGDLEGYSNFFFHFNRVFQPKKHKQLNFRIGIGAARQYLSFTPLITLEEAGVEDIDSVRIGEVWNYEYQLLVPVGVSYEFPNLFRKGSGLRFSVGVENRFRIYQVRPQNNLFTNYNFGNNTGDFYENADLSEQVNDLYAAFINPYALQGNIGIEILTEQLGSGGVKLSNLLVTPLGEGQKIDNQFGIVVFLKLPLFNLKG